MAGFEAITAQLDEVGVAVLGASVDPQDKALEVQRELSFPIAYGVTREHADEIGAWWNERRSIIQPSEFLLDGDGRVISSTYSSSPIGRIEAGDVVKRVNFLEKRKAEAAAG